MPPRWTRCWAISSVSVRFSVFGRCRGLGSTAALISHGHRRGHEGIGQEGVMFRVVICLSCGSEATVPDTQGAVWIPCLECEFVFQIGHGTTGPTKESPVFSHTAGYSLSDRAGDRPTPESLSLQPKSPNASETV